MTVVCRHCGATLTQQACSWLKPHVRTAWTAADGSVLCDVGISMHDPIQKESDQ